jgi:hypothetical protein
VITRLEFSRGSLGTYANMGIVARTWDVAFGIGPDFTAVIFNI